MMRSVLVRICEPPVHREEYRWKLTGFLELNDKGEYILPFSRRVVHFPSPSWIKDNCRQQAASSLPDHLQPHTNNHTDVDQQQDHQQQPIEDLGGDDSSSGNDDNYDEDYSDHYSKLDSSAAYEPSSCCRSCSPLSLSPFPCGDPYESYDWEC